MNGWMDGGGIHIILMRTAITSRIERAYRKKKKFQKEYEDKSRTFEL
jgi:hypothetical protein